MSQWEDEEFKEKLKQAYLDHEPTPETSQEIIADLGQEFLVSPNSIRVFLTKEGIYAKKEQTVKSETKEGSTTKRVSKGATITQLKELIESKNKPVDNEILDKLTGKAAQYFISILE